MNNTGNQSEIIKFTYIGDLNNEIQCNSRDPRSDNWKTGYFHPISNTLQKPDHWGTDLYLTIQKPGFRIPTVVCIQIVENRKILEWPFYQDKFSL